MKDTALTRLIAKEKKRQRTSINLIASENVISGGVASALASAFGNKYAEGYPGKRYYAGNAVVDELECLCQDRALRLFGLSKRKWAVNAQALSGSPANLAILSALVPRKGKVMGLKLSDGGHLTHGHSASLTGKLWKSIQYRVDPRTGLLDYRAIRTLAMKERPAIIIAGFTAYPRVVDWKKFRAIASASGALLMVDMSHLAGLVAGKAYPSPFPYADIVMTTTHKTLRGPRGALIFSKIDARALPRKIDKAIFPGIQGGPHMNAIAGIAAALDEALRPSFAGYAKQTIKNARAFAKVFQKLGWCVVTGGTDSHMILLDTWMDGKGVSGAIASDLLERHSIIVNKNAIPGDTRSVNDPSGLRLGASYETSRGKKEKDFIAIARKIDKILRKAST